VVLEGRLSAQPDRSRRFWEQIGCEVYGPLYLGFAGWLRRRVEADRPERLFFLARDGHVVERLWRMLPAGGPSASYLYGSRRGFRVPAIERLDERTLDFLCGGTSRLTVAQYFERAGLSATPADREELVEPLDDRAHLRDRFRAREAELLEVAARERALLLRYFRQEGLDGPERVALVDLGWHGTLQRAVRDVLRLGGSRTQVDGYYLGTFFHARPHALEGQRMAGYLFDLGAPEKRDWILRRCVELFELGFIAPHGGVDGYREEGGRIVPILAVHDLLPEDREKLETLQAGALSWVAGELSRGVDPALPPSLALAPMERLLTRPTVEEARQLGDLSHAEGFGASIERRPIARPPELGALLRRPAMLGEAWRRAFWEEGFKTRVFGARGSVRRLAAFGYRIVRR
jgi:hypothetical protein